MRMKEKLMAFFREESGLTALEYAVAGGVIAAGVVLTFTNLGTEIKAQMDRVLAELTARP